MDVEQALTRRHSTRWFTDRPVDLATLKDVLTLAQTAPSRVNAQSYRVHLVTGKHLAALKADFAAAAAQGIPDHADLPAPAIDAWPLGAQKRMQEWIAGVGNQIADPNQLTDAGNAFYNAPAVAFLTVGKGAPNWALYDLGSFTMALLLAAESQGLASLVAYHYVMQPDLIRKHAQVSEDEVLVIGVGLGYPDHQAVVNRVTARREPLDNLVTYDD